MAAPFSAAEFALSAPGYAELPEPTLPEVALVGRSNVGKSSLLNALVSRRALARTSSTPGKTRLFNFFRVDGRLFLVDLPGFGYARVARAERERWQRLIGRYVTERSTLRLVLHLVDARHDPMPLDREVMLLMRDSRAAYGILLTKSDKVSGNRREARRASARLAAAEAGLEVPVILTSSVDRRGLDEVRAWIETLVAVP